jgi:hypothetical protein
MKDGTSRWQLVAIMIESSTLKMEAECPSEPTATPKFRTVSLPKSRINITTDESLCKPKINF